MRLVIMQPSYLPWMGYFDLLHKADKFLFYDNVQYDKDGWRNRNKIKTPQGEQWITVPVLTKGQNKPTNKDVQININDPWQRKHLKSFEMNYRKSEFFDWFYPHLESLLAPNWERLLDLNVQCVKKFCELLDIQTEIGFVSEAELDLPEGKNEKLISLCQYFNADEFYEPRGGEGYIDPVTFESQGIKLVFQDFEHPTYQQLHGDFVSHLSIADLFFNCGPASVDIVRNAVWSH